jgi:hypothetical protein
VFAFPGKWDAFVRTYKIDRTCWVHLDSVLDVQRDNLLSIVSLEHCVATPWLTVHPITVFQQYCLERVRGNCYLSSHLISTPASSKSDYFQRSHWLCISILVV